MTHPAVASAEPSRFEPTVFGAVRRYSALVVAITLAAAAIAVGYTLIQPKIYRAQASITVQQPVTPPAPQGDAGQYLDSQVLLLQSQSVARRAASIANATLGGSILTDADFSAVDGSLGISPPTTATAGNYGATIIGVSFLGPSPRDAQVGLNSLLKSGPRPMPPSWASITPLRASAPWWPRSPDNWPRPASLCPLAPRTPCVRSVCCW
jgi:hypothetical protein